MVCVDYLVLWSLYIVYRMCSIWSCAIAIAVSVTNDVSYMSSDPPVYDTHSWQLTLLRPRYYYWHYTIPLYTIKHILVPSSTLHQSFQRHNRISIGPRTRLNIPNNQDDGPGTRSDILRILQRINVSPPFLHLNFDTFSEGSSSQLSSFRSLPSWHPGSEQH